MPSPMLFTIGCGTWKDTSVRLARMLSALKDAKIKTLVDVRHSPCSSNIEAGGTYGPKDWNLQGAGGGLPQHLRESGIEYRWLAELGNPQKKDPHMLIFREHLNSSLDIWPATR